MLPDKLQKKLDQREQEGALRRLSPPEIGADFSSNDYLGFASTPALAKAINARTQALLEQHAPLATGATGSRLLAGNHPLYEIAEREVARFHASECALIFNSGYDANIGFFQSVPQRGDFIVYDEHIHASIRDGIAMSKARAYKFKHNDITDVEAVIARLKTMHHLDERAENSSDIYVVTESVFSMDGDTPDLSSLVRLCKKCKARLIIDEAHATGVMGASGEGVVQDLGLENEIFARIVTFGKGLGAHGAAILGGVNLKAYLVNYARSLIYTTALSPHTVAVIIASYEQLIEQARGKEKQTTIDRLRSRIDYFNGLVESLDLEQLFIKSDAAIHCAIVPGNAVVKTLSRKLKEANINIKPILSPTVPKGKERLRICLHAFNTNQEIKQVLDLIKQHTQSPST